MQPKDWLLLVHLEVFAAESFGSIDPKVELMIGPIWLTAQVKWKM